MPADTNQIERFRILEKCLKDTYRKYTKEALRQKVNEEMIRRRQPECCISFRTIGNDLRDMNRLLGNENRIVAKRDGHSTYYRYENDQHSIFNTELNEEEWKNLQAVISTLSRFRGLAGYGWVDHTMLQLEHKFGYSHDNRENDLLSFDNNERFVGRENIDAAIEATVRRHAQRIVYEPFGRKSKEWTIHPWHVKQYNNRWFLFGYVEEEGCLRCCALDRIKCMERAMIGFKYNRSINFNTYFNDIVGVTVPTVNGHSEQKLPAEDILLKFSDRDFNYVVSKPLHNSQSIADENEKLISLHLIVNREFIHKILEFGSQVEVLKPASLREIIKRNAEEMLKKYTKDY